jgi:hypothetical protein
MNAKALKSALAKKPFRPIELETAGGKVITITHPENVFLAMEDTLLIVSSTHHLDMADVEDISSIRLRRKQAAAA